MRSSKPLAISSSAKRLRLPSLPYAFTMSLKAAPDGRTFNVQVAQALCATADEYLRQSPHGHPDLQTKPMMRVFPLVEAPNVALGVRASEKGLELMRLHQRGDAPYNGGTFVSAHDLNVRVSRRKMDQLAAMPRRPRVHPINKVLKGGSLSTITGALN